MGLPNWADLFIDEFPNLYNEGCEVVDRPSVRYNCIAYAAGDTGQWWWPDEDNHWPPWATRDERMDSLVEAFVGLGYERCDDSDPEDGYQKVALYGFQDQFEHAALQMPSGRWRSKMGQGPVIEHRNPESLAGGMYGNPTVYMRRPASDTAR